MLNVKNFRVLDKDALNTDLTKDKTLLYQE